MILRLTPRLTGRQIHVLIRMGEKDEKMLKTNGLVTFSAAEYRVFLSALRTGSVMSSPCMNLMVDDVQLGGV